MAYRSNPFLERLSEKTTSDQEFVQFFSPKVLEHIDEHCLDGGVHVFRSPPGGGKTTILRAFTPKALEAFWHARRTQPDAYRNLARRGVFDDRSGPQLLGVLLSCASGYADLPPGVSSANDGIFRALLDCRIVLRALRSLAELAGPVSGHELSRIRLEYDEIANDLKEIPLHHSLEEMTRWAERREREVYQHLDEIEIDPTKRTPAHKMFEGVLWLQAVRFVVDEKTFAPRHLLMIDDLQKLRKSQRTLILDEIVNLRPQIPVWLASRIIAFSDQFLTQGARNGRDIRVYPLEELWSNGRHGRGFTSFAENILDRRFALQSAVPAGSFSQYLAEQDAEQVLRGIVKKAKGKFEKILQTHGNKERYREWIRKFENLPENLDRETLLDLIVTRILIARDEANRQMTFELGPLTKVDLEERDSASVKGAAAIFAYAEIGLPYYFGIDRICAMSTNNVEELLGLAAELYEGMKAKQVLRREPQLFPHEQEKRLRDVARKRRDFIPKTHTDGLRAQRLLDAIGVFCRERTFQINAPYAPGVTGVRLSNTELSMLENGKASDCSEVRELYFILFECVAENLLVVRESSQSTGREGGSVFYLSRGLCTYYGLPLQYGGWQETTVIKLIEWMVSGRTPKRRFDLVFE